ncbi:hypothetical protein CHS0354_008934 [Potamilus streckersoni]|uniref:Uncharacterized protein n=1 Tax=Potamilus streckersoni TaxID=2493646 RepID=A0AAE0THI3_9BIVA|nr:hypothetical protein CHS0354_008934 [Potamilus streckersoni]
MLSSSKRKFIETWQKEVSEYMKEGNICRVVVAPVTPDNKDDDVITNNESKLKALFEKPDTFNGTFRPTQKKDSQETLPYFNVYDTEKNVEKALHDYITIETNGRKSNGSRRQHSGGRWSGNKYSSGEPVIVNDYFDPKAILQSKENKKYKRKSSKTAKEIYEKYTSIDPNYMDTQLNHHRRPPTLLSQIPWRTKTFLELPFRFSNSSSHYASIDPHRSGNQIGLHKSKSFSRRIGSNDSNDPRPVSGEKSFFE